MLTDCRLRHDRQPLPLRIIIASLGSEKASASRNKQRHDGAGSILMDGGSSYKDESTLRTPRIKKRQGLVWDLHPRKGLLTRHTRFSGR